MTPDELMAANRHLAEAIATQTAKRLGKDIQASELLSDALFGLWQAAQRFDPGKGWKFKTYAGHRIAGEIADGLRRRALVPRYMRRRRPGLRYHQFGHDPERRRAKDAEEEGGRLFMGDEQENPPEAAATSESCIEWAAGALPAPLNKVIRLYYGEGHTQVAIAQELGVSESRVSQLRKEAIGDLRRNFSRSRLEENMA